MEEMEMRLMMTIVYIAAMLNWSLGGWVWLTVVLAAVGVSHTAALVLRGRRAA